MNTAANTKANSNGFRWHLLVKHPVTGPYAGRDIYAAYSQKRCTTDSGRVYFCYASKSYEFETIEDRDTFIASFSPEQMVA